MTGEVHSAAGVLYGIANREEARRDNVSHHTSTVPPAAGMF